MVHDDTVYDLGEVDKGGQRPVFSGTPLRAEEFESTMPRGAPIRRPRAVPRNGARESAGVGPALAGSLSLFVPGLGQMVAGEVGWGLLFLTWIGFCGACLWALTATIDRLVPTLRLLDVSVESLAAVVGGLAITTIALHVTATLHAQTRATGEDRSSPHPIVTALASLLVPGWGQLLAGHRRRAGLFLFCAWLLAAGWLAVTPQGTNLLARLGQSLPPNVRDDWGPAILLAGPAVLWIIAVYDAAAGAVARRREA